MKGQLTGRRTAEGGTILAHWTLKGKGPGWLPDTEALYVQGEGWRWRNEVELNPSPFRLPLVDVGKKPGGKQREIRLALLRLLQPYGRQSWLALQTGVTRRQIALDLEALGLNPVPWPPGDMLVQLAASGYSMADAAAYIGCSKTAIRYVMENQVGLTWIQARRMAKWPT